MKSITLLQPRHSYAPSPEKERFGDRVIPNTLLHVRARLMEAGITTHFIDHNFEPKGKVETDIVGLTVLGMPYIPIVRSMANELVQEGHHVLIGGQTVEGLIVRDRETNSIIDRKQFDAFFGTEAIIGNDWNAISTAIGVRPEALAGSGPMGAIEKWQQTSLVPAYEALSEEELRFYLQGLVPLEIAQGCKEKCTFCFAQKNRPETYRNTEVIERDLAWLLEKAAHLEIDSLNIYLTNLDLFQTPGKLSDFAKSVIRITEERQSVQLKMRGLCMVESFDNLHTNLPTLLHTMRSIGLEQIGAGVDGGSDDVRRSVGKKSKDEQCIEFVEKSGTIYGIRPQPLMVNGHELDTAESMKRANDFLRWASSEYGAIPRPHCSKMIPGNLEWSKVLRKKNPLIPFLHDHSEYCQAFDFCAPPSSLTHPDPVRREMIELFFREACAIDGGITEIVEALDPECTAEENERRKEKNLKHYDV